MFSLLLNFDMTVPNVSRLLLICPPSTLRCPSAAVAASLSEPARSTRLYLRDEFVWILFLTLLCNALRGQRAYQGWFRERSLLWSTFDRYFKNGMRPAASFVHVGWSHVSPFFFIYWCFFFELIVSIWGLFPTGLLSPSIIRFKISWGEATISSVRSEMKTPDYNTIF